MSDVCDNEFSTVVVQSLLSEFVGVFGCTSSLKSGIYHNHALKKKIDSLIKAVIFETIDGSTPEFVVRRYFKGDWTLAVATWLCSGSLAECTRTLRSEISRELNISRESATRVMLYRCQQYALNVRDLEGINTLGSRQTHSGLSPSRLSNHEYTIADLEHENSRLKQQLAAYRNM
jgi:hypothetical protein